MNSTLLLRHTLAKLDLFYRVQIHLYLASREVDYSFNILFHLFELTSRCIVTLSNALKSGHICPTYVAQLRENGCSIYCKHHQPFTTTTMSTICAVKQVFVQLIF